MTERFDALVIGSGAAGYGAADRLYREGFRKIAVLTEGRLLGTSRNTGSDKQTYYKLSLCGEAADSPAAMARDLMRGGCMDGDKAYAMAQLSPRAFYRLVELGVPFPQNDAGGYPGYRTDHDNTLRATSVGPLTSRLMTEALEKCVAAQGARILDGYLAIRIVSGDGGVCGVIALNLKTNRLEAFSAPVVVSATGAPACVYEHSAYPVSQHGMTGVLIAAGVPLVNFSQWQYGLCSVGFRWNLSGSFLQVAPRLTATDAAGNTGELLASAFPDPGARDSAVFQKGYAWPFSADRAEGCGRVDLAWYAADKRGCKVTLDYTKNPDDFDFSALSAEAAEYLRARGVTGDTPILRLRQLNKKAERIFADNGVDLSETPLPVCVGAQHCNGGAKTDANWQTPIAGLYVIGEAAGSFGLTRPGGSALNETQISGYLAAAHAACAARAPAPQAPLSAALADETKALSAFTEDAGVSYGKIPRDMSKYAAFVREQAGCEALLAGIGALLETYPARHRSPAAWYRNLDMLRSARALLVTILGEMPLTGSRGGALWYPRGAALPTEVSAGAYQPEDPSYRSMLTVTDETGVHFTPVAPIPADDRPFEYYLNRLEIGRS